MEQLPGNVANYHLHRKQQLSFTSIDFEQMQRHACINQVLQLLSSLKKILIGILYYIALDFYTIFLQSSTFIQ